MPFSKANNNDAESLATIESLLDSEIESNKEAWTLSVASKGIHGFIVFANETKRYRADLRPKTAVKSIGIGTQAEITFQEVTAEECKELKKLVEICPNFTAGQLKKILERIQTDIKENKQKYYLPGDGTTVIAKKDGASNFNNCISYCQKIVKEELDIDIGNRKSWIKYPPKIVAKQAKHEKEQHQKKCCEVM